MLEPLKLKPIEVNYVGYIPPAVQPLLEAAARGGDMVPVVERITRSFGFEEFNCGVSMSVRPGAETLFYVFTTMPPQWVAIYDQRSYIEVDPRVQTLVNTPLPIIWDQDSFRGRDAKVDAFLDAGLEYGLGSGVAIGFVGVKGHGVMVALNSKVEKLDLQRKAEISRDLGDITLFAHFFYEIFMAGVIQQHIAPRSQGAPLSARERECVTLAAHGLTGDDIANKLGITARTVQFHFDSIRSKLAAVSRQEAVAKAVQAGIVNGLL